MESNIIVAGVGGQGVVTAGTLISQAALEKGLNVVMSEIHGLAQRGGSVSVEIRIGDVKSPIIPKGEADIIIGLEPMEGVRAAANAGTRTKVLLNSEGISPISLSMKGQEYPPLDDLLQGLNGLVDVRVIDALPLAIESGDYRSSSTVMVGAALQTGVLPVDEEAVLSALGKRFSGRLLEINMKALRLGMSTVLASPLEV